ncbi:MAG TPA: hypothetical protein VHR41_16880 [Gemmatimonadales bacterium]|nr:hypothetical protein [Gemmatimonadales bacterium]
MTVSVRSLLALAVTLASPAGTPRPDAQVSGYAAMGPDIGDTLHPAAPVAPGGRAALGGGIAIDGYLSPRGLPPLRGQVLVTDSGLVFHSADNSVRATFPLIGPVRQSGGRLWRAPAVSLAYATERGGGTVYLFRMDGAVFETRMPGPLLEVAGHPAWLDSLVSREWAVYGPVVSVGDTASATRSVQTLARSSFADSLYALFGRPSCPFGLVGERGRSAGRLGEYIASRDSLSLDPWHIGSEAQMRHALAHELAHRWQARAPAQFAILWQGVPPIQDPKRYGHESISEHQAEAVAFAIHFLQTTAAADPTAASSDLLEHYELLVPGTSVMARYLALQPLYRRHPLRKLLTTGRIV